jgi:hypothetical protein
MPALKDLLEGMNVRPGTPNACRGMADPRNAIIPFGQFENLHFARFVILDDQTLSDLGRIGEPVPAYPVYLAFLGDCDGCADHLIADMAQRAGAGLRDMFSYCEGFHPNTDLLGWMKQYSKPAAAAYVNHIGRTVRQIRQEAALRQELVEFLGKTPPANEENPRVTYERLLAHVRAQGLIPKPPEPTPTGWHIRNLLHATGFWAAVAVGLALIAALVIAAVIVIKIVLATAYPFPVALIALLLVTAAILFAVVLRVHEEVEPELVSKPSDEHAELLAEQEDYDVANQFSIMGSVKPSAFRRWLLRGILWGADGVARHVYNRGTLARIKSIHFARWIFLDGHRRGLFASNYDGSLESYNDDFINKAGFGLNLAFGGGLAYPRTKWLIFGGAKYEQKFKYTLRRLQVPTQVWYNAYPGLTVYDLARNARVREGVERATMSDAEIRAWLADL